MGECPNCGSTNEEGVAECIRCGQRLRQTGWLGRLFGTIFRARASAPLPEHLKDFKNASDESRRMQLFEQWLEHESDQQRGFAVFVSERGCFVQFQIARESGGAAEVGGSENVPGEPELGAVHERLLERGFSPPNGIPTYSLVLAECVPAELAQLAEWAFREVLGEEEHFLVRVDEFGK